MKPQLQKYRLAIVGSGPAGFYTAIRVLGRNPQVEVDMFEASVFPYGLVRYGIAPDHPEVKNVKNKFDQIALDKRFSFFGNVRLGSDVSIEYLKSRYDGIVLAYGASKDRMLNIPGESLNGVHSARNFVGWYNGNPASTTLQFDLDKTDHAVIIGLGNVALDVARVLLSNVDTLAKTDMPEYALEALRKSRVRHVTIMGRRGPVQVAFTSKEVRELVSIGGLLFDVDKKLLADQVERYKTILENDRARSRLVKILSDNAQKQVAMDSSNMEKRLRLLFLASPTRFIASEYDKLRLGAIEYEENILQGAIDNPSAVGTGVKHVIVSPLCFRSIGYQSVAVSGVPYDQKRGLIPNIQGRIRNQDDENILPGLYVSGWLKTGPMGVIAATMYDSYQTADCVSADIQTGVGIQSGNSSASSRDQVMKELRQENIRIVTFDDWKRIEAEEIRRGSILQKPGEKFTDTKAILDFLDSNN